MSLPTSRDITLIAGVTAVPPNLICKLEDMFRGAKHPNLDFPHGASGFEKLTAGVGALLGDGQWTFTGGGNQSIVSRIRVPRRSRIRAVKFGYNRGGAGAHFLFEVRKRNIVTGAAAVQVIVGDVTAGTGWTTGTLTGDFVIEADTAYWIQVTADNAANIFGGAIVTVDR